MARFEGLTIDVSQHQGAIDWQRVYEDGVRSAYVRATMGVAGLDARLQANALNAPLNGVLVGFYHLLRPEHEGAPQAEHFLDTVDMTTYSLPLAVDVELDNGTPARIADVLRDFVLRLKEATGRLPAIYTGAWFWNANVGSQHDSLFAQCPLWVAEYGVETPTRLPRGFSSYWLHQYTSQGVVAGIAGDVDLNRPAPAPFTLLHPVKAPDGCRIVVTSRFGVPRDYDGDGIKDDKHEGVDYAPVGNACLPEIVAGADGVVDSVSTLGAYGNRIRLRHIHGGDTYYSWYCHLSRIDVSAGEVVRRGQVIGVMGSTGNSTGLHIHINLQWIGHGLSGFVLPDVVNPEKYIVSS